MEIQPIGKRNLLIYLNGKELMALSVPPSELKTDDAAGILRRALGGEVGCGVDWSNMYLELFAGKDSLLLVARAHSGDPHFFMFRDIESIIEAAQLVREDIISFLSYCDGAYYLIVYPWDKEPLPNVLLEYGQELSMHSNYAFYLTEHGKTLLGPSALDELKKLF